MSSCFSVAERINYRPFLPTAFEAQNLHLEGFGARFCKLGDPFW